MSSTSADTVAALGTVTDLREHTSAAVLAAVVDARKAADREEARLLALAVHWVDLHPVTDLSLVPGEQPLGGDGTPGIGDYAVEELAAALGVGYHSGLRLVIEAVELCFRLPRLWALVQEGRLQAWKARQVAAETTGLSRAAVGFVDRHAATTGARNKIPPLRPLIHEALCQCDPDQAAGVEQAALDARGVWLDHRHSTATTLLTATMDTLDALDLDDSIAELAVSMGRLGDVRPLEVRRASALGMLAHPQRALDLVAGDTAGPRLVEPVETPVQTQVGFTRTTATLYLQVSAEDLAHPSDSGCGEVEKLGIATLALLRDWLHRASGVTIRPVLDLSRGDSVDVHDPPGWMREAVTLRDRHCVFPGCGIDARGCDLDHIEAYESPDDGGPPGQTTPGNLACLCRRHHRLKTFTAWTYHRALDGTYRWTSPTGRVYTVTT